MENNEIMNNEVMDNSVEDTNSSESNGVVGLAIVLGAAVAAGIAVGKFVVIPAAGKIKTLIENRKKKEVPEEIPTEE